MRDERWFNDDVRKEIYQKYDDYYSLFEALLYPDSHGILSHKLKNRSFSAQELELILILRQAFPMDKKGGECLLNGFNQLAGWFKRIEQPIGNCDYLFIQAYISFICEQIKNNFHDKDLDATTKENLIGLAQLSVDMAEFYANRSTEYKYIQLSSDRQHDYIEERNQSLYRLLYSLRELSRFSYKAEIKLQILSKIKDEYQNIPAVIDEANFKNLYEYLGYLNHFDYDNRLYQTACNELKSNINRRIDNLTLPDLAMLIEDDIYTIVDTGDLYDINEWNEFAIVIKESHEYDTLLIKLMDEFLNDIPQYFPN